MRVENMKKAKKHYYSAESAHGSESSHGFSNDTIVFVFDSKLARDNYVAESRNISCHAIKRSKVTAEAANWSMTQNRMIEPKPFTNCFWGIRDTGDINISGCIGYVDVMIGHDFGFVERFYK